jgi:hypothetical protein
MCSATRQLSPLGNATMQYNAVDSPVGVIPVTRVDPTTDALHNGEWPTSKTGGSWIVAQACARAYDPEAMKGIPVGVQVRLSLLFCCRARLIGHEDCRSEVGGRKGAGYDGSGGSSPWREGLWVCSRCPRKSQLTMSWIMEW